MIFRTQCCEDLFEFNFLLNYIMIKININVKDSIYKITKAKYIFFVKIFKKNKVIFLFSQKNIFLSVRSIILIVF